jgi:hypothetical protein
VGGAAKQHLQGTVPLHTESGGCCLARHSAANGPCPRAAPQTLHALHTTGFHKGDVHAAGSSTWAFFLGGATWPYVEVTRRSWYVDGLDYHAPRPFTRYRLVWKQSTADSQLDLGAAWLKRSAQHAHDLSKALWWRSHTCATTSTAHAQAPLLSHRTCLLSSWKKRLLDRGLRRELSLRYGVRKMVREKIYLSKFSEKGTSTPLAGGSFLR